MISHARAERLMAMAIDFSLTNVEQTDLADHLATCSSCRARAAGYRSDAAAIRMFAFAETPAFVRAAVLQAAARPAPRSIEPWKLLVAAALLLTALLGAAAAIGAWNSRPALIAVVPSVAPSQIPSTATTPDVLLAACDGSRPDVSSPVVGAQPDGVHISVTNTSGKPLDFSIDDGTGLAIQGDSVPGANGSYVYTFEPGAYGFTCDGSTTAFTVTDPGRTYLSPVTWCTAPGAGGSGTVGTSDYGEGTRGPQGSLLDIANKELHGLTAGDVVERAGYSQAAGDASVRVVRDGRVVAVIGYIDDGHGGWLIGGIQACQGSDVTVKPATG